MDNQNLYCFIRRKRQRCIRDSVNTDHIILSVNEKTRLIERTEIIAEIRKELWESGDILSYLNLRMGLYNEDIDDYDYFKITAAYFLIIFKYHEFIIFSVLKKT